MGIFFVANPQIENGHVKIANEIFDALCRTRINGEARQVLDFIFRKTYGFNKKNDAIALSQFCQGTLLKKPEVCRALRKLLLMNIIGEKANSIATMYWINKDFTVWEPLAKKPTLAKLPKVVGKTANKSLAKKPHTIDTGNTKDNVTKDSEAAPAPPTPSQEMLDFISNEARQVELVRSLEARGVPEAVARAELTKFLNYWCELTKSGTKQRWQLEKTFELKRRLTTWFNNAQKFAPKNQHVVITDPNL